MPQPGPNPKDPLYFVTELRGTIKVVTNDRSVFTFAEEVLSTEYRDEAPEGAAQLGLGTICLAPGRGYVFVTFAYQDAQGILRNNIIRFETRPKTYDLTPRARIDFRQIFLQDVSGPSHQIGSCQVRGDTLYVGVGDGYHTPEQSQHLESTLGKVLRMSLDGEPLPSNPFYKKGEQAAKYVWAYGLRNQFSLEIVSGRVFVADNGKDVDRFLEVERGQNYLWDRTDWSIGTRAGAVMHPVIAPVQMAFHAAGGGLFPSEYDSKFFVAAVGNPMAATGPPVMPGVVLFDYDFEARRMREVPRYFLEYRGSGHRGVVGLGFGPDGLYVVPLAQDLAGGSAILRVSYRPESGHPLHLSEGLWPDHLMTRYGCLGCHSLSGQGGRVGPPLDRKPLFASVRARLDSAPYVASLVEANGSAGPELDAYRAQREEVLHARDSEQVLLWVKNRIWTPRFDNPNSAMPTLGVSEAEAVRIAEYLLTGDRERAAPGLLGRARAVVRRLLPSRFGRKHVLLAFSVGLLGGAILGTIGLPRVRKWRVRRAPGFEEGP